MIENLTREEIDFSMSKINDLEGIDFKFKDENGSIYIFNVIGNSFEIVFDQSQDKSFKERHKLNNLIKWNSEITIKIIHLRNTFIYLSTFFERYKVSNSSIDNQYFIYFAEIISYYFVSIRDCILQLINSYIDFPIQNDYEVNLKKIKNKLNGKYEGILSYLNEFETNTERFREDIRNSFSHKVNPFNHYYVTSVENENNMGVDYSKTIENEEFYKEIIKNIEYLSIYIEQLRKVIKY